MKRPSQRVLVHGAGAILLAQAALCGWAVVRAARTAWLGLGLYASRGSYEAASVARGGPAARQTSIKTGQRVLAVDGRPPSWQWFQQVSRRLRPGDLVTIAVEGPNGKQVVAVRAESPLRTPAIAARAVGAIAVALAFWLAGLWFYRRDHRSDAATLFFLYVQLTAALYLLATSFAVNVVGPERPWSPAQQAPYLYLPETLGALATILLLHFALAFPKDRPGLRQRRVLECLYGFGLLPPILSFIQFPLMSVAWPAENWVVLACAVWVGVIVSVGFAWGWRALVRRPVFVLPLLWCAGALLIVYSARTSSNSRSVAVMKGIDAFPHAVGLVYALLICLALLAGLWQTERTERGPAALAVGGIVLSVLAGILPTGTLARGLWLLPQDLQSVLVASGLLWFMGVLLVPLGVSAMLLLRRQTRTG